MDYGGIWDFANGESSFEHSGPNPWLVMESVGEASNFANEYFIIGAFK